MVILRLNILRGYPNFDPVKYVKEVSHVIINFEEKSGGSKFSRHVFAPRDSPPSHTLLDQNLDPRVVEYVYV